MEKRKAHYELTTKNFRAGTYDVVDVSSDPSWDNVKCVESCRNTKGELTTVVNHRDMDFDAVCASFIRLGARGGLIQEIR
jgi:hypothetical protein